VWDDVTSRDFHFRSLVSRPDPMTVLRDSSDGDARAKAMANLKEPRRNGGSDAEQEEVMRILTVAATSDSQPLCRMAAVQKLGTFQDARAVPALTSAYEAAAQLPPEVAEAVQSRALSSLGETRQPAAINFLVTVATKRSPADGTDRERQQARTGRIAAVRALNNYDHSPEVADAMAQLMQNEKDVALRDRARETYVKVTGHEPPADSVAPPVPMPEQADNGVRLTGGTR
jgi:HEAT repeat protein